MPDQDGYWWMKYRDEYGVEHEEIVEITENEDFEITFMGGGYHGLYSSFLNDNYHDIRWIGPVTINMWVEP